MVHRVEHYADGGKVIMPKPAPIPKTQLPAPKRGAKPKRIGKGYADGGKVARKGPKPPRAPVMAHTADVLRNQRKRQEQALGLRDGGPVRKYADGGKVTKKVAWPRQPYKPRGPMPTPDSLRGTAKTR